MAGQLVDHCGKPLAPSRKSATAFRAAEHSRLTSHLPSICRPTEEEMGYGVLPLLRARSRYIYNNHAHAHGAINLIVRRIAGAGMAIQARLREADGSTYNRAENAAVEGLWHDWAREGITVAGHRERAFWKRTSTYRYLDGEVFLLRVTDPDSGAISQRYQIIRGDQLAENTLPDLAAKGNTITLGVERTPAGRIVAYHMYTDGFSANYYGAAARKIERIPAERVIAWTNGDFRGIPLLTPVVLKLADIDEYTAATLTQAWAQANVVAFIKSGMAGERMEARINAVQAYPDLEAGHPPRRYEDMIPGVMEYLNEGEDITFADPKSPSGNFEPFTVAILRTIAAGLGISYEALARDYTKTNYSSGRQTALEDKLTYREMAGEMDESVTTPIWRDFIDQVYVVHRLRKAPDTPDIYSHYIQHPQPGWVDPQKEMAAWQGAIDYKLGTRREACAERGRDFFDVADELAEEEAYLKSKGLSVEAATENALGKVIDIAPNEDDEDEEAARV